MNVSLPYNPSNDWQKKKIMKQKIKAPFYHIT